jgi:hypothetical protein
MSIPEHLLRSLAQEAKKPPTWRRNGNGNLTRNDGDRQLVVFRKGDGYAWVVNSWGKEPWWSPSTYSTEQEAKQDVLSIVNDDREYLDDFPLEGEGVDRE